MTAARIASDALPIEPLRDDEIHVWQLAYARACGREPLLRLLAAYLDVAPSQVSLADGEHGRPRLALPGQSDLQFNWSHSGGRALIAVARGIQPGVDLEQDRPRPRALELARRFFAPHEAMALQAMPATEREAAFLRYWTAKEAVLKAVGRGLAFGLHRVGVSLAPHGPVLTDLAGDKPTAWQLYALPLGPDYVGALAWRGGVRTLRLRTLPDTAACDHDGGRGTAAAPPAA